jgi:hypothetical protein
MCRARVSPARRRAHRAAAGRRRANIYLDRLDKYVEDTLLPAGNRGAKRHPDPTYTKLTMRAAYLRRCGRQEEALVLRKQAQHLRSKASDDPEFRRLRYVRYADDFLLGFIGPRHEAEAIKDQLGEFLRDQLKLELSEAKTLLTHASSDAAAVSRVRGLHHAVRPIPGMSRPDGGQSTDGSPSECPKT